MRTDSFHIIFSTLGVIISAVGGVFIYNDISKFFGTVFLVGGYLFCNLDNIINSHKD